MSTYEAARTDVAKRIEETMAGLRKFVSRDRQSPLELTVSLLEDTASLGRSVIYLDRRERQREWADDYRKAVTDKLEFVAIGTAEFLLHCGVKEFEKAFVAEYERAAVKHPGMTLDCDGPTDELRFYALAEEVGEVAASLTYDNANSTGHNADTIAEVTQVGALALAWLVRYQDGENR